MKWRWAYRELDLLMQTQMPSEVCFCHQFHLSNSPNHLENVEAETWALKSMRILLANSALSLRESIPKQHKNNKADIFGGKCLHQDV